MLPTDHNKLLMRWKGPFSVIDKIGQTDYRIQVGKNQKVFHINMLLEYTERGPDEIGAAVSFLDVLNEDNLSEGLELCVSNASGDRVEFGSSLSARQRVFAARVAQKPAGRQRHPDDPWHARQARRFP